MEVIPQDLSSTDSSKLDNEVTYSSVFDLLEASIVVDFVRKVRTLRVKKIIY